MVLPLSSRAPWERAGRSQRWACWSSMMSRRLRVKARMKAKVWSAIVPAWAPRPLVRVTASISTSCGTERMRSIPALVQCTQRRRSVLARASAWGQEMTASASGSSRSCDSRSGAETKVAPGNCPPRAASCSAPIRVAKTILARPFRSVASVIAGSPPHLDSAGRGTAMRRGATAGCGGILTLRVGPPEAARGAAPGERPGERPGVSGGGGGLVQAAAGAGGAADQPAGALAAADRLLDGVGVPVGEQAPGQGALDRRPPPAGRPGCRTPRGRPQVVQLDRLPVVVGVSFQRPVRSMRCARLVECP